MSTVWTSRQGSLADSCFCSLLAAASDKEHEDFALLLKSYTSWIVSALLVVSQFSILSRLRVARAGGQWRLSDYAHGLESFWSNCLQGVHDHNAGIELRTCDTGVCQLAVPHCLWEKSHDASASR